MFAHRITTIAIVAALLVSLSPFIAMAQEAGKQPAADPKAQEQAPAATEQAKTPAQAAANIPANLIAVCGCGKAFVPNAATKSVTHGGKSYACCSDACHKMASADPAGAAKMADQNTAKFMAQLNKAPATATTPTKPN